MANDAERIGAFIEPDWVITGPDGLPGRGDRFLELVASGELTHEDMSFEVLDARIHGDVDAVLAPGTNHAHWQRVPFSADE